MFHLVASWVIWTTAACRTFSAWGCSTAASSFKAFVAVGRSAAPAFSDRRSGTAGRRIRTVKWRIDP